jgi:hypothetical protein
MNLNREQQNKQNQRDKIQRKLAAARGRNDQDMITKFTEEMEKLSVDLAQIQNKQKSTLTQKEREVKALPFSREITRSEQADIGKLKKSVRGLIIVHPMTKLGKELGLDVMTGFASRVF